MKYLVGRLQPLIKGVQSNGDECYQKLEGEIAHQAEKIRKAGYDLRDEGELTDADADRVRKFADVHFDFYNKMGDLQEKRTEKNRRIFNRAAENLGSCLNEYVDKLKRNIGKKKYAMLAKRVEKNIKKPSLAELHFPSISQFSLSYSSVLLADSEPVSSRP